MARQLVTVARQLVTVATLFVLCGWSLGGVIYFGSMRSRRMSGGTTDAACNYPGVVSLTHPTLGYIFCMGAQNGGKIIVPLECAKLLKSINVNAAVGVKGSDGSGSSTIAKATLTLKDNLDGTATVGTLSTALPKTTCTSVDYTRYDPKVHTGVDASTCAVVSYSSSVNNTLYKFDGKLKANKLVTSPLLSCRSLALANVASYISTTTYGTVATSLYSTKDVTITDTASAAFCKGDLGSPIYCSDSATGSRVLVGLVASSNCVSGETFLSYDLTGGAIVGFSLAA